VYDNHNKSARHIRRKNTINNEDIIVEIPIIELCELLDDKLCCSTCKKKYTTRSGLWKHKKKCLPKVETNIGVIESIMLAKINELQNQLAPLLQNTIQTQEVSAATEIDLETKTKRIEVLEKTYLKKQKRHHFEDNNVIYIVTTEDNKLRRNYIVGKARNLTNRLSTYNKTAEHEVVYYMKCHDEQTMGIIEAMVMKKLEKYRECANRDRFILPEEADISLFTDAIDTAVAYFEHIKM
jgi:hypothetical protein